MTEDERTELKAVYGACVERYLAAGYGTCLLKDAAAQHAIGDILSSGNGVDYALHVWCIMPNHLHVIVGSFDGPVSLAKTLTDWKRISSHRINRLLNRKGPVWQADSYTRIIRDVSEYVFQLKYVWHNPEAAGLKTGFARERYVPVCA